jgi:hypothetical protein
MKIDIVVRSELTGDDSCSALGFTAKSFSPVLALCRQLVEAGHDPSTPLEAWLRARSIGEAAGLEINPRGTGFRRASAVGTASPIRLNECPPAPPRIERTSVQLWARGGPSETGPPIALCWE